MSQTLSSMDEYKLAQQSQKTRWQARLQLEFCRRFDRTLLTGRLHEGPLRIQRPFYPEADLPHTYLLHPPGGVVDTDLIDINVKVQAGANALITTPGATKFYRSSGFTASVKQVLQLQPASSLEWFPQDNIYFPGAQVNAVTRIDLHETSTFMGWDITCLGRPSNNETFSHGDLFSRLQINRSGAPILNEFLRINTRTPSHSTTAMRNYPMQALFIATPCNIDHLQQVRSWLTALNQQYPIAVTLVDDILLVRALGHHSQILQTSLLGVWQYLRPQLLGRPAVFPRIWAT